MGALESYSRAERREIPIIINNFNRYSTLRQLIERLQRAQLFNLYVLDNDSTYEPLLQYYKVIPANVIRLHRNVGYLALWESAFNLTLGESPFIYTDADLFPDDACPDDFIDVLFDCLIGFPQLDKVGLGLRLDDLPSASPVAQRARRHEAAFWKHSLSKELYQAAVDTSFALYRPGRCGGHWLNAGRTAPPYLARHAPWYLDPMKLDEEERFYRAKIQKPTFWSSSD